MDGKALIEKAWDRFWWLRGAIAAMSLISLVPAVSSFSRFEFLRDFHAIVVAWDDFVGVIAEQISRVLNVPDIASSDINAGIFFVSFCIPAAYSAALWDHERGVVRRFHPILLPFYVLILFVGAIMLMAPYWFLLNFEEIKGNANAFLTAIASLLAIGFAFWRVKSMLRGFVFFFVFVLSLEALYYLNVPYVRNAVNSYACDHVGHECDIN